MFSSLFSKDSPIVAAATGITNGLASIALSTNFWVLYDQIITRIGATATALVAIVSLIILLKKLRRSGKNEVDEKE